MSNQNLPLVHKRKTLIKRAHSVALALSAVVLMAACSSTFAEKESGALTDANIAAIVVGANKIDISAGEIALQRSNNKEIKKFARRMVTDHKAVLQSAVDLVTELNVTPVNNDLVATLSDQSQKHEAKLLTLTGNDFDKEYIDHEVAYHEAVINVIEEQLIPSAKNKQLKEMLVSVLPAFRAHLSHCRSISQSL